MHPASAVDISQPLSAYLRMLHYDTCLYEPAMLDALVDRVGAYQIVMGADYPVGEPDPVGFVRRCDRPRGSPARIERPRSRAARMLADRRRSIGARFGCGRRSPRVARGRGRRA